MDTETAPVVGSVNLLDKLTEGRQLPDGFDGWAIRTVHPDFLSSNGYRYPFPGQVAEAPGPIRENHHGACPRDVGDGICAAVTWEGMASGGVPARTLLLVAYRDADVLGREGSEGKLRFRRFLIVELLDGERLVRENGNSADLGYANLGSADLRYANLGYANLRSANLRYANLGYADLGYANLGSADLRYANLGSADLGSANLGSADLRYANLGSADLGYANLGSADLRYANLGYANLRYANLGSANLGYANLGYANVGSESRLKESYYDADRWMVRSDGLIVPR